MSSLQARSPYSPQELAQLYPSRLELRQVQVIFRHGERTPVSPRLQNAGVPPFWPYCHAATRFTAAVLRTDGWDKLAFQRRLETFGKNGEAVLASLGKTVDGVCLPGELTDRGRETTFALGARLRNLYVDKLAFLPKELPGPDEYYLRATPIVRALESLQQVFSGLYPAHLRDVNAVPIIHTRSPHEENLFPNDANCRRFNQLARAFAALAAEKHNGSPEMQYLQSKIGKWMPEGQNVAVNGHPRLSGLMDSINATLAHGEKTRLPAEFYDPDVRRIMNDINVDEWYRGYSQSSEYRRLGVGSLLNDVKDRAIGVIQSGAPKFSLMGCHDTTIAGLLATLGAFDQQWPPFTSSIAVETFRLKNHKAGIFDRLIGKKIEDGWFVRLRYNDTPVIVKGCKQPGKHLEEDESFCTMTAFKEIVEKIAPANWTQECMANMDKPGIPPVEELD
ncbi:histidine phosphatase superfamily [Geopyxis carbonaria]|nr:histidine phosphatase superfamily [Geopyxis carbonaria]